MTVWLLVTAMISFQPFCCYFLLKGRLRTKTLILGILSTFINFEFGVIIQVILSLWVPKSWMRKKFNLSIDCEEVNQMQASIFSEIGKDGLRFLREDIHVGPEGMTTIAGSHISSLLKINKESVSAADRHLGKGASATVQEGLYLPENIRVAIKTINIYDRDKRHQIMNDIRILLKNIIQGENSGFSCNFIVNMYGAYFDEGAVKVILELMDAGSLQGIIALYRMAKISPAIQQPVLSKIALQILCGISFLHSHNLVHRDIKPGNILLNTKGEVKVTDFGISKEFIDGVEFSKTFVGTRSYMSPERIEGYEYSYISDIWSFGLVMFQLTFGYQPYTGKSFIEMQQNFMNEGSPKIPHGYSCEFEDFLMKCLQVDSKQRLSALQLLGHQWIIKNISAKTSIRKWLMYLQEQVFPFAKEQQ